VTPGGSDEFGHITIDGELTLQNATLRNANLNITLADLGDGASIINNDISLLESSSGYGGQFFVAPGSTVECNTIMSEGDRYFDLLPDPMALAELTIQNNHIQVIIKQGTGGPQGELLELRSHDHDCAGPGPCASGAIQLADSPGFMNSMNPWVLESLTIEADAKVTLTNRQGFDFDPPNSNPPEALYVKNLTIAVGAILNTGFQRLYYQTGSIDPTAQIVDIPLLGFSLGTIAMEDDTEFGVRVRARLKASTDFDDPTPPGTPAPPPKQGAVTRITLDPQGGVMEMRTHAPGFTGATSVAAKGAFEKVGEDEVVIAFEYQFVETHADTELRVFLSDQPDVSVALSDELASIAPPAAGLPGSVGSSTPALFFGTFPRGNLNFHAGTYIEIELVGADSIVWIDDWDPLITCTGICGDFNGTNTVEPLDYLYLATKYGSTAVSSDGVNSPLLCLDGSFNNQNADHYVDLGDLLAWDTCLSLNQTSCCVLNPIDLPTGSVVSLPSSALVVAGKSDAVNNQPDALYPFDPMIVGRPAGAPTLPASAAVTDGLHRGNGRLATDSTGALYQLHATQGLVRLDSAATVVPPTEVFDPPSGLGLPLGSSIRVGVVPFFDGFDVIGRGLPITDAAFSPDDPQVVYVVPVQIVRPAMTTYRVAARLRILPGPPGAFEIEKLYGFDPMTDPLCPTNTTPPGLSVCDVQHQREIEVGNGRVYVTSAKADNDNDWLLVYNAEFGAELSRSRVSMLLSGASPAVTLDSPTALLLDAVGHKLYMAASINPSGSTIHLFRFDAMADTPSFDGVIELSLPTTGDSPSFLSGITAAALDDGGVLWVTGFTAPEYPDDAQLPAGINYLPTWPSIARIGADAVWAWPPAQPSIVPVPIACQGLALPISIAFNSSGSPSPFADFDADQDVDLIDAAALQACFSGMGPSALSRSCLKADGDGDSDVDLGDFAAFLCLVTGP